VLTGQGEVDRQGGVTPLPGFVLLVRVTYQGVARRQPRNLNKKLRKLQPIAPSKLYGLCTKLTKQTPAEVYIEY